jgi:hypothetical protein
MIAERLCVGEANDDEGSAGRQVLTEVGESVTERQMVDGGG